MSHQENRSPAIFSFHDCVEEIRGGGIRRFKGKNGGGKECEKEKTHVKAKKTKEQLDLNHKWCFGW
jgi:hypothetical protein